MGFLSEVKNRFFTPKTEQVKKDAQVKSNSPVKNNSVAIEIAQSKDEDRKVEGSYSDLVGAMRDLDKQNVSYKIVSGDTLWKIAQKYGVTVNQLKEANPGINPNNLKIGQKINIPVKDEEKKPQEKRVETPKVEVKSQKTETKTYKIVSGDTLWKIAQKYGVTVDQLKEANPGINPNNLKVGQTINITKSGAIETKPSDPPKTDAKPQGTESKTYSVKSGDNLWKIANANGVTVEQLKEANPGINPNALRIGQQLNIPVPKPVVVHSDMKVDSRKYHQYKEAIVDMMKAKGVTDEKQLEELPNLIIQKSIELKVDPVLIAGIIGQEVDFRYLNDNIYGDAGKGAMQLTSIQLKDMYAREGSSVYRGGQDKFAEIKKEYPTWKDLWNALKKKENYKLNIEVGIIAFKSKLETDYILHPELSEEEHISNAVENYNGNNEQIKNDTRKVKERYRDNIVANYNAHVVS